ncbi:MAG: hypothetical protein MZV70_48925 [Desulfobacterales bacterium]|nr:hypothetical protein [Desulfobacterales bacterium]
MRQGSRMAAALPGMGTHGQMRRALEPAGVRRQDFAAPDRAVGAVAGAVAGHADHRRRRSLCSAMQRSDVGVMVLHRDLGGARVCSSAQRVLTGSPGAGRRR